jgi:hypothetical protein
VPAKTDIFNSAFALLGQGRITDADTDTSENALWGRALFGPARDETLRAHPWNFAAGRAILSAELLERTSGLQVALKGAAYSSSLGLYVVVGGSDGTQAVIFTSPDLVTWTQRIPTVPKAFGLNGVVWNGTAFIAFGDADGTDGYLLRSTNGTTWAEIANAKNFALNAGAVNGATVVLVGPADGTDTYILRSTDSGATFSEIANTGNTTMNGIVFTGGLFVAVGEVLTGNPKISTSPTGATWTNRTPAVAQATALNAVGWDGTRLVAVGDSTGSVPHALLSTDGTTWNAVTGMVPKAFNLYAIATGNGFWVAAGDADPTASPADTFVVSSRAAADAWAERTAPKDVQVNGTAYLNGNFVFTGNADGGDGYLCTWPGPPTYGYTYCYQAPSDLLRIYDINDGDTDYKLEGGSILSNSWPLNLRYTRQVTDLAQWDVLAAAALGVKLAMRLNPTVTGDTSGTRYDSLLKEWRRVIGEARTTDAVEDGEDPPVVNSWIAARRVGAGVR